MKEPEKLIVNGKRLDGRALDELRPMEAKVGIFKRADGSAMFRFGNTVAVAAVYGPRALHPKFMQDPQRAILRCRYNMAPFSTEERIRPGTSRRSVEISKIMTDALSQVIFFEEFPKTAIDVFVEILQADSSTRCAALNAASLALADAGIPMQDLIASCSVGKIDGQIVLDVGGIEDNFGDVDIPLAIVPKGRRIVLLQVDGILSRQEFLQALVLANVGLEKVYAKQKEALKGKYVEAGAEQV